MFVVINRCTFCGRKLTEKDLLEGRVHESGFDILCERCFLLFQRRLTPTAAGEERVIIPTSRSCGHEVRKNRSLRLRNFLKGALKLASASCVLAAVTFVAVVMLDLHRASDRPHPAPLLSKKEKRSAELPSLLRHVLLAEYLPLAAGTEDEGGRTVSLHPEPRTTEKMKPPVDRRREEPKVSTAKPAKKEEPKGSPPPQRVKQERPPTPGNTPAVKKAEKKTPQKQVVSVKKAPSDLFRRIEAAIKKGRRALIRMQGKDGIWRFFPVTGRTPAAQVSPTDYGCTALALWALLVAGEPRDSKAVQRGFKALMEWKPRTTYTSALVLLAVEAYCRKKGTFGPRFRTTVKRNFKVAGKKIRDLARRALNFLVRAQLPNGYWTYHRRHTVPDRGGGRRLAGLRGDLSNTQFAMLALDAARRMGLKVPVGVFKRNLKAMLESQQKDGPAYPRPFFVPAAELDIRRLRAMEKSAAIGAKNFSDFTRRLRTRIGTVADNKKIEEMRCRGFPYSVSWIRRSPYLAMTAAGLANLVICKAALEERGRLTGRERREVRRAIRDAAAWIAAYHENARRGWGCSPLKFESLYALLSLERAGVMAVLERFGTLNWYVVGAKVVLSRQMADGSWRPYQGFFDGNNAVATSFALLFLARGVAGVVGAPGTSADLVETGKGLFKDK